MVNGFSGWYVADNALDLISSYLHHMGYFERLEFAGLGLLALLIMSTSSPGYFGSLEFRLWIVRYAGLVLEDGFERYENKYFQMWSFYSSSSSDNKSRKLILQIVKKSVKFLNLAIYLVMHHDLISWFILGIFVLITTIFF
ncbi:hypothetical protein MKW92_034216 [Papaver armeniacum]|nr:hypothetical protein MKW92_034216 [Papaver armeniacum]